MTVEFSTTAYQMSHGKQPRGTGMWGFFFNRMMQGEPFWHTGSFADAKKAARAEAQRRGACTVYVGP